MVYEWHASVNALSREAKTRLMCPTDMESDQEMLAKILGVEYGPMEVDFGSVPFFSSTGPSISRL